MKVFQIINNKCHWDATAQFPTVESTVGFFPPTDLFVEAPDYVREGWGYADGEFTEPPADEDESAPTQLDRVEAQAAYTAMMTDTLLPEV